MVLGNAPCVSTGHNGNVGEASLAYCNEGCLEQLICSRQLGIRERLMNEYIGDVCVGCQLIQLTDLIYKKCFGKNVSSHDSMFKISFPPTCSSRFSNVLPSLNSFHLLAYVCQNLINK